MTNTELKNFIEKTIELFSPYYHEEYSVAGRPFEELTLKDVYHLFNVEENKYIRQDPLQYFDSKEAYEKAFGTESVEGIDYFIGYLVIDENQDWTALKQGEAEGQVLYTHFQKLVKIAIFPTDMDKETPMNELLTQIENGVFAEKLAEELTTNTAKPILKQLKI